MEVGVWTELMCLLDLRTSWVLRSNREEAGNEEVIKASFFPEKGNACGYSASPPPLSPSPLAASFSQE